jgi:hypothetical protein
LHRSIILLVLVTLSFSACGTPAPQLAPTTQTAPKWTDVSSMASYDIQVTLDIETKMLSGHELIT